MKDQPSLCISTASLSHPTWRTSSAWTVHAPFGFWLVDALRPQSIVELGSYGGMSYFVWCQAAKALGCGTSCLGVDVWQGDPFVGYRRNDIAAAVQRHNTIHYSAFSRLKLATFDDVLREVPDGSVDLLHLDGAPSSAGVVAAFRAWLPKMSPRSVVVIHKTRAVIGGDDLAQGWREVSNGRPHFEFHHGFGLGLVQTGLTHTPPIDPLFSMGEQSQSAALVRRVYAALGADLDMRPSDREFALTERLAEADAMVSQLWMDIARRESDISAAREEINRLRARRTLTGRIKKFVHRCLGRPRPTAIADTLPTDAVAKQAHRARLDRDLDSFLRIPRALSLPKPNQPRVSVVVLLFNQAAFTLACLKALALEDTVPIEVILVDNGSTDETADLLRKVDNVRVIRNEQNEGFVRGVNQGASVARGEYLLLLNNDAIPRAGALARAVNTLDETSTLGAVGGRLVLPDGTLQEAGSIVWDDGSCLGCARGLPEEHWEAMFFREVDYCSAAFLLIRRKAFEALGGFDEDFSPAYSEEVDFCLRLRKEGLAVAFDPEIVVDHFEFASSSDSAATRALQGRNVRRLREKHAPTLANHHPAERQDPLLARTKDTFPRRILFLDDLLPIPSLGSGTARARHILQVLIDEKFFITFWPQNQPEATWADIRAHVPRNVEVVKGLPLSNLVGVLTQRAGFYSDLLISRPHNMRTLRKIRSTHPHLLAGVRVVYDAEAMFAFREITRARLVGEPLRDEDADRLVLTEAELVRDADAAMVVSQKEAEAFRRAGPTSITIVSHALPPTPTPQPFANRRRILFVGRLMEQDSPNADSIAWFLAKIFPQLRQSLGPDLTFDIVGLSRGSLLKAAVDEDHVTFHGAVEDVVPFFNEARVFVAPTRFGAGIPCKVLEAAAHGVPCVTTSLLADQLGWRSGTDLLAANTAHEFTHACVNLFTNETLWNTVRVAALDRITHDYSPDAFSAAVRSVFPRSS